MQCPTCIESSVTAFCRECGKGVCESCAAPRHGVPYCADCAPAPAPPQQFAGQGEAPPQQLPPASAPPSPRPAALPPDPAEGPHPFLAGLLGFVPGLGAVYNGQYVKGVIHAAIFGMLFAISVSSNEEAIHALLIPITVFFFLYMPVEAVRTARALRRGERVDEMSGIAGALMAARSDSPVPGIFFIALGVLFLLFTLGILEVELVLRAWPLAVIALGVWRLYASIQIRNETPRHRLPESTPLDLPE